MAQESCAIILPQFIAVCVIALTRITAVQLIVCMLCCKKSANISF